MERVNESEYRFLTILWEHEPILSPDLAALCLKRLGWKKSTTYTVIKRLTEKHLIENNAMTVRSHVSKEKIDLLESEALLGKNFNGSLPAFVATFLTGKKLSREEAEKIRAMLEKIPDGE